MAYRQLCAVTFAVLGLGVAACGGGPAASQTDDGSDQPPSSVDQAPVSSEKPPGNPDQPPGNPDQPPSNPDQPPSGNPTGNPPPNQPNADCQALCEQYGDAQACQDETDRALVRPICTHGCRIKAGEEGCESALLSAVSCVRALTGLCTEDGPGDAAVTNCQRAVNAAQMCIQAAD